MQTDTPAPATSDSRNVNNENAHLRYVINNMAKRLGMSYFDAVAKFGELPKRSVLEEASEHFIEAVNDELRRQFADPSSGGASNYGTVLCASGDLSVALAVCKIRPDGPTGRLAYHRAVLLAANVVRLAVEGDRSVGYTPPHVLTGHAADGGVTETFGPLNGEQA